MKARLPTALETCRPILRLYPQNMAVHVTDKAAAKIRENLLKQSIPEGGLRLGVKGGGCSGLSYVMRYEPAKKTGDKVFEENGARLFVDLKSYLYLKGMTLDWTGSLMQQRFVFLNPNASKSCSCGHSFSV